MEACYSSALASLAVIGLYCTVYTARPCTVENSVMYPDSARIKEQINKFKSSIF